MIHTHTSPHPHTQVQHAHLNFQHQHQTRSHTPQRPIYYFALRFFEPCATASVCRFKARSAASDFNCKMRIVFIGLLTGRGPSSDPAFLQVHLKHTLHCALYATFFVLLGASSSLSSHTRRDCSDNSNIFLLKISFVCGWEPRVCLSGVSFVTIPADY
mgnify:CR=1 FL=1